VCRAVGTSSSSVKPLVSPPNWCVLTRHAIICRQRTKMGKSSLVISLTICSDFPCRGREVRGFYNNERGWLGGGGGFLACSSFIEWREFTSSRAYMPGPETDGAVVGMMDQGVPHQSIPRAQGPRLLLPVSSGK
jgi:hypothetical protein